MPSAADPILELPFDQRPDPHEFVRAAMRWHFSPETGSPFWLQQVESLGFDPLTDVKTFEDLARFPNVANKLRDARVADLIPRGYGPRPDIVGVYDSGGTTGAPKRVVMLREWLNVLVAHASAELDAHGVPHDVDWLTVVPSGPHMVGDSFNELVKFRGGVPLGVDVDPRWVKKLIARGERKEALAYTEHLVDQLAHALRTQDIGVLLLTPPTLDRISRRDELVELIAKKVKAIMWVGTQLDPDTRALYRNEIFPGIVFVSGFGNTMTMGHVTERPGLGEDEPCIYDPFSPYMTYQVVDEDSGEPVPYGDRGRVIMHYVGKSFLLPNNLERDYGTRIEPLPGCVGDAIANIAPVKVFDEETVIEGVY